MPLRCPTRLVIRYTEIAPINAPAQAGTGRTEAVRGCESRNKKIWYVRSRNVIENKGREIIYSGDPNMLLKTNGLYEVTRKANIFMKIQQLAQKTGPRKELNLPYFHNCLKINGL